MAPGSARPDRIPLPASAGRVPSSGERHGLSAKHTHPPALPLVRSETSHVRPWAELGYGYAQKKEIQTQLSGRSEGWEQPSEGERHDFFFFPHHYFMILI